MEGGKRDWGMEGSKIVKGVKEDRRSEGVGKRPLKEY